jgi:phage terminase large subunit
MIKDIIAAADLVECFSYNLQDLSITCKFTQNTIKGVGLQDVKTIKGSANYHFAWYEEPNTDGVTYNDFMTLDTTLRSASESGLMQSIFTFNSDSPDTWLKSEFFPEGLLFENELPHRYSIRPNEAKEYKTSIIHFTYKDNRYISAKRVEKLESLRETDPTYYKIWTLGLWGGDPQGKIYQNWEICESMPESDISYTTFGVDWGFNDPMTLIEVSIVDRVIYVREHYYESGKQAADLRDYITESIGAGFIFYADHRPEQIAILRNSGQIHIQNAKKDILDGIMCVKHFPLRIEKNSVNLIRELKRYSWRFDDKQNKYLDIHHLNAQLFMKY